MAQPNKRKELGKGIRALLNNINDELMAQEVPGADALPRKAAGQVHRIPLNQIHPNPDQPRKDFDAAALAVLAESIRQHDIIQPITVRKLSEGNYQIVSGERRWKASQMAELKEIPAYIRTADDQQLLEMALLENLQREDLNPIEISLSYRRLMEECGLSQEQLAQRMGMDRSTVANYLRLTRLPPDIQQAVREGKLSMGHARALLGLDQVELQLYAFREVQAKGLSVRQTEKLVQDLSSPQTKGASASSAAKLPPAFRKIEDQLSSHFSTRVRLQRKKNGKGALYIEFYSDEDLDRILQSIQP